ncbi:MAG TPA: hypothetical protein PKD52_03220 [Clostridiales bacterium]|nr:hypothetical protein [Clostridiales bacterium]
MLIGSALVVVDHHAGIGIIMFLIPAPRAPRCHNLARGSKCTVIVVVIIVADIPANGASASRT